MESASQSPFHHGEREVQTLYGERDQLETIGQRFIRIYMPGERRQFFVQLPFC